MARGYTKEFLIDAFMWRYEQCPDIAPGELEKTRTMVTAFYEKVPKDEFRKWCSLDAEKIAAYKQAISSKV